MASSRISPVPADLAEDEALPRGVEGMAAAAASGAESKVLRALSKGQPDLTEASVMPGTQLESCVGAPARARLVSLL